ncbi:MAG: hypothetical protein PHF56_19220 [Desulfuromonadaceae bacterium]|nr:hypothetical protein [Desulfuromonadaceae bacterium]
MPQFSADAWSGGVCSKPVITFNRDHWDIVEVTLAKDLKWLNAQLGKKYDWLGIFGLITIGIEDPEKWYCSELAAAALGMKNRQVSPGELYGKIKNNG